MANFRNSILPSHQSLECLCMNKLEISENPDHLNIEASGNHIRAKAFKEHWSNDASRARGFSPDQQSG